MIIFGGILLLVAVGLFFAHRSALSKMGELLLAKKANVQELKEMSEAVTEALGEGHLQEYTSMQGRIHCDTLLTAPLSGKPCVYYRAQIEQQVEVEKERKNSEGETERYTSTETERLYYAQSDTEFYLEDEHGRVRVQPDGADWDLESSLDERTPHLALNGSQVDWNGRSLSLTRRPQLEYGARIKGYTLKEWVFEPSSSVYILGCARDRNGVLQLNKPDEKGQRFIISSRSKESQIDSLDGQAKGLKIGAMVCAALGVLLSIAHFIVG